MRKLVINSVTCLQCGETLISRYRHDYNTCNCDNETMVDGGLGYGRYGGKDLSLVQTNYLYTDSPHEKVREHVERGTRGKNGDEELRHVKLKNIDDDWLKAIIEYEEDLRPNNPFIEIYKNEVEWRKRK